MLRKEEEEEEEKKSAEYIDLEGQIYFSAYLSFSPFFYDLPMRCWLTFNPFQTRPSSVAKPQSKLLCFWQKEKKTTLSPGMMRTYSRLNESLCYST